MAKVILCLFFVFQKMCSWNASKVELNNKTELVLLALEMKQNCEYVMITCDEDFYTNFNNFIIFCKNRCWKLLFGIMV